MPADRIQFAALLRGLGVLLILPLLVTSAVTAAHVAQASAPRRPGVLPPMANADVSPVRLAIQIATLADLRQAAAMAEGSERSRLIRVSPTSRALVLAPRRRVYQVSDLARFRRAIRPAGTGAYVLRVSVVVPSGATLVLAVPQVTSLQLRSTRREFANIVAFGGTIEMRGTPASPLIVSSFDEQQRLDRVLDDGRAFVLNKDGGAMDLDYVHVTGLGFGTGLASGVSWVGTARAPARGRVMNSTFRRNQFGAYTFRAADMLWQGNVFEQNRAYGFDPHDLSNGFLVRDNLARENGRHGFIFSRGCDRNVLVGNRSLDNRGHGFMIDDGRSDTFVGPHKMVPSSRNVLEGNIATRNGRSGIEIEGGAANVVRRNRLVGNVLGIRYRGKASGTIAGNSVARSRLYGIEVEDSAGKVVIRHNRVTGSWSDLTVGRAVVLTGNHFEHIQAVSAANGRRRLDGPLVRTISFLEFRPGLTMWAVVLFLPLALRATRARPRQHITVTGRHRATSSSRPASTRRDGQRKR